MDRLIEIITYFMLICVAAERFTDILKRAFLSKLTSNGVIYQLLSACFGAYIGYWMPPENLPFNLNPYLSAAVVGLCVSGGSSFWNSILSTITDLSKNLKELKKA